MSSTIKITTIKITNASTTSAITQNDVVIGYITHGSLAFKTCWKSGGIQRQAGQRFWITNQEGICRMKLEGHTEFKTRKAAIAKLIATTTKETEK